jgi:hypothetical protein
VLVANEINFTTYKTRWAIGKGIIIFASTESICIT